MPYGNAFQHQTYSAEPPQASYELLTAPCPFAGETAPTVTAASETLWDDAQRERWRCCGPAAVILVHGTFTGTDALGWIATLEHWAPEWGPRLHELGKRWVDRVMGETGNYTPVYTERLQQLVDPARQRTQVRRLSWSGENHHTGRAFAAIQLIDYMIPLVGSGLSRLLLWGHSHAGNVFALVTNLLGGERGQVRRFLAATRPPRLHAEAPAYQQWQRVHDWLFGSALPPRPELDIVTFGTPIRYGWEQAGYRRLLHVVHHRPSPGLPVYRTRFPLAFDELLFAHWGDSVQQMGIAGSDFLPSIWNPRMLSGECRLQRLLAASQRRRETLDRLQMGQRVHADGHTLLVDYPDDPLHLRLPLFGHALYTRTEWLEFHLQQVTRYFYGDEV